MDRITDGFIRPRRTLEAEYRKMKENKKIGNDTSDLLSGALERIEDSVNDLAFKIKEEANEAPSQTKEKMKKALGDVEDMAQHIKERRKDLSAGKMKESSERVLEDIKDRLDRIIDRH